VRLEVRPAARSEVRRGSETLLVVEDEEGVRELMQAWLESHGYRVLTAGNGVEALEACEAFDGTIDLVVADMVMPAMGGPALARRLKPLRPDLKVMFISGYADVSPGDRDVLDEPTLFLQKPFALSALVDTVRRALDQPRVVA
jgi:DNA-binding NtrC family response regulator